ncbi:MAG TPA: DUF1016 domain-containing protein [Methanophagales archaeon]|nr:DUF1016 domain-containing protein [Methanophagales archaeon]
MTEKKEYIKLLTDLKTKIRQAQYKAYRAINTELISLYWDIGESIVAKQEELGWGQKIIRKLSEDLQKEFPKNSGFSERNLKYMRQFYLEYKDKTKMQPLVAQIPWSHNLILLDKTKNDYEKEYYCRRVLKYGWSKRILVHQIETKSFERFLADTKSHNFEYKIVLEENEYFIDLLFYHRYLKCLIAIDLKIGKFIPEYAGKMNFYLNLLDDKVKLPDENHSIGLILCKEKDNIVVEYALRNITKPMGVAKYYLTRELPADLVKQLPAPEVIEAKLKELEEENEK